VFSSIETIYSDVSVHIDVYSAETGISKFLELNRNSGWVYDKTEGLESNPADLLRFTHLLVEAESEDDSRVASFKTSHTIQAKISAYGGIEFYNGLANWSFEKLPSIKVIQKPRIFILKKKL
jgi:alpha-1,6-mannosyltransferase